MRRIVRKLLVGAMVLGLMSSVSLADESLAQVQTEVAKQWSKVRSLSAETLLVQEYAYLSVPLVATTKGLVWHIKRDGKEMYRKDLRTTQSHDEHDNKVTEEYTTNIVADGKFVYSYSDPRAWRLADKADQAGSGVDIGGEHLFDEMKSHYALSFLKSDKLDGRDVFVIEGLKMIHGRKRRAVYYIAKDIGVMVKREAYEDGKLRSTWTLSNIEINVDIPADIFEFKAPEGVEVVNKVGKNWDK